MVISVFDNPGIQETKVSHAQQVTRVIQGARIKQGNIQYGSIMNEGLAYIKGLTKGSMTIRWSNIRIVLSTYSYSNNKVGEK